MVTMSREWSRREHNYHIERGTTRPHAHLRRAPEGADGPIGSEGAPRDGGQRQRVTRKMLRDIALGRFDDRPPESRTELSYIELYEEARRRNIRGRSKMNKLELERALGL
jgi:hypothetical protein